MTRARNSANLASHGNLFVDITNDRTGIGSVVPAQSLHVAGTAGFHDDVTLTGDLYNTIWDRSANTLQLKGNAILKIGQGSYATTIVNNINTTIEHSPITAVFLKTNDLQIVGSGNRSGTTYDNGIFRARTGIVELGHEIGNGGATGYKLATTAYGVNVTGTTDTDGLVVSGVATVTTMNVTGVLTYDDVTSVDSVGIVTARQGVRVTADGSNTANYISVGAGDDFRLFHDGSNTYLKNNTGDLYLKSSSNDYIKGVSSTGSVELKYGGTTKFSTQNHGATLQGNLNINGTVNANVRLQSGPNTVYASVTFFNAAGSASNSINSYAASILFITGRDATVFSDSSAEICEIVSSGIHPRTASTACALGTSSKRWDNVYADAADIAGDLTITDSIVHASDTNTKIRFPGTDIFTVETAGTERVRVDSAGLKIEDKLLHMGDIDTAVRFPAADTVTVETGGNERYRVNSSGQVLIGTTTAPAYINRRLTVAQGDSGNTTVAIEVRSPTNGDGRIIFTDSTSSGNTGAYKGQIRYDQTNDFMSFNTNGDNERLRINQNGHVQIGVAANPGNALRYVDIANYNTGSSAGSILRLLTVKSDGSSSTSADIVKYKAGGLVINNNEAIGTTGYISFGTATAGGSTTERLRINSSGNVRLSNSSGAMLDLRTSASTGNCWVQLSDSSGNQKGYFGFGSSSNETLYIVQQESANISLYIGNATRWNWNTSGHYYPQTDSQVDIGTSSNRVRNIYSDQINMPGLTFNGTDLVMNTSGGRAFITRTSGEAGLLIGSGNAGGATVYLDGDANGDWSGGDYAYIQHTTSGHLKLVSTNPSDNGEILFYVGANVYRGAVTSDGILSMTGAANSRAIEINPGSNAGSMVIDRNGYITSMIRASDGGSNVGGGSGGGSRLHLAKNAINFQTFPYVSNVGDSVTYTTRASIDTSGHFVPGANNTYDLGSTTLGWRNVYMNDLNLSNMRGDTNDVDGTQGSWTIQEGKDDLYIINRLNGKKFKIKMEEIS